MVIREYINITKVVSKENVIKINADAEIGVVQIPTHRHFTNYWGDDAWSISATPFLKRIKRY